MSPRVVFIPKGDQSVPSSRYRCFYFAEVLEQLGLETHIVLPPPQRIGLRPRRGFLRETVRLAGVLRRLRKDDILYLQRPLHNTPFVGLVLLFKALRPNPIVFDYCDPVFMHSPRKTALLARVADVVVVSCEDLAEFARRHCRRVEVVPNSIPSSRIGAEAVGAKDGQEIVVGWVGNASVHRQNLRRLRSALATLERPVKLRLIGTRNAEDLVEEFRTLTRVHVEAIEWLDPSDVDAAIRAFDIAVLPLEMGLANQKLLTKLIEYMAAGVPVVATPVGENTRAIRHGENGFLAESDQEWSSAISSLAADPDLRKSIGASALRTIRDRYSLEVNGVRLAAILADLRTGS